MDKLNQSFFKRNSKIVAKELLGKILIRKISGKILKARIIETEAYLDENDPGSRASKGKNKISEMMWAEPGRILIYNVHKYKMFNIVTGKKAKASAVLIRALEPLNFKARCSGPGLLTNTLKINNKFHGKFIFELNNLYLVDDNFDFEIFKAFRIGLKKDLPEKLRYYIKENKYISKK